MMKRISPGTLIGLFLAGGVIAYLTELILQSRGGFVFIPPLSLSFTLVIIAVATLLVALPIRRRLQGKSSTPLDPFYASRVVALSKASALAGAVFLGVGAGVLMYLLGRPILPGTQMLTSAIAELISSALLIAAGLIAEWWCALPPEDNDPEGAREPAA
jgi:Protein of unknown function (DUF3180)